MTARYATIRSVLLTLGVGLFTLSGCVAVQSPSGPPGGQYGPQVACAQDDPLTELARSIDRLVIGSAESGPLATEVVGAPPRSRKARRKPANIVRTAAAIDLHDPLAELDTASAQPPLAVGPTGADPPQSEVICYDCAAEGELCLPSAVPACPVGQLPKLPDMGPYLQPAAEPAPPGRFFPVPTRPVFAPRPTMWPAAVPHEVASSE